MYGVGKSSSGYDERKDQNGIGASIWRSKRCECYLDVTALVTMSAQEAADDALGFMQHAIPEGLRKASQQDW